MQNFSKKTANISLHKSINSNGLFLISRHEIFKSFICFKQIISISFDIAQYEWYKCSNINNFVILIFCMGFAYIFQ